MATTQQETDLNHAREDVLYWGGAQARWKELIREAVITGDWLSGEIFLMDHFEACQERVWAAVGRIVRLEGGAL